MAQLKRNAGTSRTAIAQLRIWRVGVSRSGSIGTGKSASSSMNRVPATPNGLEMSRLAGEGRAAWAEIHSLGEAGGSWDLVTRIGYAGGQPRVNQRPLATGPGGPGRLHRVVGRQVPAPRKRDPRLAGAVRWKGSEARSAPPWRATPFVFDARVNPVLDGPSRAYNGLEMSRPASQAQYRILRNLRLAGSAPSSC